MTYQVIQPPASLKPYIRSFWIFEGNKERLPYIYRSMADNCAELIFHYKGVFEELQPNGNITQYYAGLHGQSQQYRRFFTHDSFGIFGIYIYPFAIPALFGISSGEASDHMPDLQTLLGNEGRIIEEQMMLAVNNQERLRLVICFLQNILLKQEDEHNRIHLAIRDLIHSKDRMSITDLSQKYFLSTRQFERKFKEYAGFTPKLYSRITRFQNAVMLYTQTAQKQLTEIDYECGYYDQSHFISEFKQFSGYHPRQYFRGTVEGGDWRDSV